MISPYVRRLRLAAELRDLRVQAGLTHAQLAKLVGESRSQISRLENAHVVDQGDIMKILDTLKVEDDRWTQVMTIAREAAERGWWESHRSMGERQAFHANLEAGAKTIREFQMTFIPGLLQTSEYTQARVHSDAATQGVDLAAAAVVSARQLRQRMLHRPDGPVYDAILDEVAVTRLAVPPEVAKAQLYNIGATVNARDKCNLRVLSTNAAIDGYSMPRSSFSIYTFPDPNDPAVVAVDTITEDLVLTDHTDVKRYEDLFARLNEASLAAGESLDLLASTAAKIT